VGRRVWELRGFDTNQAQFAGELGVSQGQLSRYEKATLVTSRALISLGIGVSKTKREGRGLTLWQSVYLIIYLIDININNLRMFQAATKPPKS
jgi:transcriptional regulator with XRE-family HTH domain